MLLWTLKATINKKKLWYYMRLSTVSRQLDEIIEKLDAIKMKHCLPHLIQINSFTCKMREFKKSNECDSALSTEQKQKQEEAIRILQEKINEIQPKIKLYENNYLFFLVLSYFILPFFFLSFQNRIAISTLFEKRLEWNREQEKIHLYGAWERRKHPLRFWRFVWTMVNLFISQFTFRFDI